MEHHAQAGMLNYGEATLSILPIQAGTTTAKNLHVARIETLILLQSPEY